VDARGQGDQERARGGAHRDLKPAEGLETPVAHVSAPSSG
jgi:hypothetical protein